MLTELRQILWQLCIQTKWQWLWIITRCFWKVSDGTVNAYMPRLYWGSYSLISNGACVLVCAEGWGRPFHCFQADRKWCPFLWDKDNSCHEPGHCALPSSPVCRQVSCRCEFSALNTPLYHIVGLLWYRAGLDSPDMSDMQHIVCFLPQKLCCTIIYNILRIPKSTQAHFCDGP